MTKKQESTIEDLDFILERLNSILFRTKRLIRRGDKTTDWVALKKETEDCKKETLQLYNEKLNEQI